MTLWSGHEVGVALTNIAATGFGGGFGVGFGVGVGVG